MTEALNWVFPDLISTTRGWLSPGTHAPLVAQGGTGNDEFTVYSNQAELRLDLPFAGKGDVALKKIGLELVVRVDGHKRTIVLPGALAGYRPTSATLEEGALVVGFEHG